MAESDEVRDVLEPGIDLNREVKEMAESLVEDADKDHVYMTLAVVGTDAEDNKVFLGESVKTLLGDTAGDRHVSIRADKIFGPESDE